MTRTKSRAGGNAGGGAAWPAPVGAPAVSCSTAAVPQPAPSSATAANREIAFGMSVPLVGSWAREVRGHRTRQGWRAVLESALNGPFRLFLAAAGQACGLDPATQEGC